MSRIEHKKMTLCLIGSISRWKLERNIIVNCCTLSLTKDAIKTSEPWLSVIATPGNWSMFLFLVYFHLGICLSSTVYLGHKYEATHRPISFILSTWGRSGNAQFKYNNGMLGFINQGKVHRKIAVHLQVSTIKVIIKRFKTTWAVANLPGGGFRSILLPCTVGDY